METKQGDPAARGASERIVASIRIVRGDMDNEAVKLAIGRIERAVSRLEQAQKARDSMSRASHAEVARLRGAMTAALEDMDALLREGGAEEESMELEPVATGADVTGADKGGNHHG